MPITKLVGLDDKQLRALADVRAALPHADMVLVGAMGLGHHIDMSFRSTSDVDLVLGVEVDDFPGPLTGLSGWRTGEHEHRFYGPGDVRLDILPAGPELRAAGELRWKSDHTMSLVGFDLAFEHCDQVALDGGSCVLIPHAPVFLLLKIAAWTDRPADRAKDLQDIAYLLEHYLADDDDRHWSDPMVEANLDHDLHSAYSIGIDLGTIARESHRTLVEAFLAKPPSEALIARAPWSWKTEGRVEDVLAALARGLDEGRGR